MNTPPTFMDGLVGVLMIALFFFVARVFFLWYFKIDKLIALLGSIDRKLGPMPEGAEEEPPKLPRSLLLMREKFGWTTGVKKK